MSWRKDNKLHCEIIAYIRRNKKYSTKYKRDKDGVMSLSEVKRSALLNKYNAQQVIGFVRHRLSLYITNSPKNLDVICKTILMNDEATARKMAVHLMDELSYQYVFIFNDCSDWGWSDGVEDQLDWDSNEVSYRDPTSPQWRVR